MALLLLVVLGGCSIRKLAYGMAGRFINKAFIDACDLGSAQKSDLLPRVAALHEWHRRNELPRYVQLLDGLMDKAQNGFDRQELDWVLNESAQAVERLSARGTPQAAAVLATLSDDQINHLAEQMKKSEHERFDKLDQSEEEYFKHRLKIAKKNMKTWLGSYTDAQLAEYERFYRKNRGDEIFFRKHSQGNQQALLKLLRAHQGPAAIQDFLYRWMTRQTAEETPEFKQIEERVRNEFIDLVLNIDRLMSPEQRQHMLSELRSWRSDFQELATAN